MCQLPLIAFQNVYRLQMQELLQNFKQTKNLWYYIILYYTLYYIWYYILHVILCCFWQMITINVQNICFSSQFHILLSHICQLIKL